MNNKIGKIGSIINVITVLLFALFLITGFKLGYFFVCIIVSLSFIMMIAALENECKEDNKVAGKIALILAGVYSTLIMIVYFTQCTSVINDKLSAEALKYLLLIHGVFFISCLIMPMTGIFANSTGSSSKGGIIALEIWCAYFLPIGILSYSHFKNNK